jgi:CRP/FNR family cyclic AMP-dependent transcriptional regulator
VGQLDKLPQLRANEEWRMMRAEISGSKFGGFFSDNSLFSGLKEEERRLISQAAIKKVYAKNTIILSEGDTTDSLYMVCRGRVKVSIIDEYGKEIILAILGPGEYFGEMTAMAEGASRSACVMTREPCELMILQKEDFRKIVKSNPDIVFSLLLKSMERLREANKKIESLALLDVYGRVARLFAKLGRPENGGQVIDEKLTHQDIASMVGSSREMVSRVLKELSTGGYISINHKTITVNGKLPYSW